MAGADHKSMSTSFSSTLTLIPSVITPQPQKPYIPSIFPHKDTSYSPRAWVQSFQGASPHARKSTVSKVEYCRKLKNLERKFLLVYLSYQEPPPAPMNAKTPEGSYDTVICVDTHIRSFNKLLAAFSSAYTADHIIIPSQLHSIHQVPASPTYNTTPGRTNYEVMSTVDFPDNGVIRASELAELIAQLSSLKLSWKCWLCDKKCHASASFVRFIFFVLERKAKGNLPNAQQLRRYSPGGYSYGELAMKKIDETFRSIWKDQTVQDQNHNSAKLYYERQETVEYKNLEVDRYSATLVTTKRDIRDDIRDIRDDIRDIRDDIRDIRDDIRDIRDGLRDITRDDLRDIYIRSGMICVVSGMSMSASFSVENQRNEDSKVCDITGGLGASDTVEEARAKEAFQKMTTVLDTHTNEVWNIA
ncbi:hypothetical protein BJ138DRAFT_1113819 [Hygrophoropsis aurantiaca]|uniref:Uncharacterized protein n=1 Tax=Hygrophoropsis aurantiaca TaxID=72124 RepID=A0ACB8AC24_9AGAM|nr:hypothetical protein BJ138DRAFT_1113819 [Hygrophoropsis aurantiaca]